MEWGWRKPGNSGRAHKVPLWREGCLPDCEGSSKSISEDTRELAQRDTIPQCQFQDGGFPGKAIDWHSALSFQAGSSCRGELIQLLVALTEVPGFPLQICHCLLYLKGVYSSKAVSSWHHHQKVSSSSPKLTKAHPTIVESKTLLWIWEEKACL